MTGGVTFLEEYRASRASGSSPEADVAVLREWLTLRPDAVLQDLQAHAPEFALPGLAFVTSSGAVLLPGALRYLAWAYPLLPLGCSWAAWRAYVRGEVSRALWLSSLPLILAIPLLLYAWYLATPVG
jgi:hypothetical protein